MQCSSKGFITGCVKRFHIEPQKGQGVEPLRVLYRTFCRESVQPRPGQGHMLKTEGEAKVLMPRSRPNFWPQDHFGLEDLTLLV